MKRPISDIAFTSAVKQAQEKRGSRKAYARNIVAFYRRTLDVAAARSLFYRYYKASDGDEMWEEISRFCRPNAKTVR